MTGIYMIKNKINGKYYIGSAVNLEKRWETHKNSLKRGDHKNSYLQNAWDKYGSNNFEFIVLEDNIDKNILLEREQYYLNEYDVLNKGYNLYPIAGSPLGTKWTDKRKKDWGDKIKGKNHHSAKLTEDDVIEIRRRASTGEENCSEIAKDFNISRVHVRYIAIGKLWSHVKTDYVYKPTIKRKMFFKTLKMDDVIKIKKYIKDGRKLIDIAKEFNVSISCISSIKHGRTHKGV